MNPNLAIHHIMTSELITVAPEASLKYIKSIFESNDFHHLPVVGESGMLKGIISREDYYKVGYVLSKRGLDQNLATYDQLKAKDIMTEYPVNVEPDDSIGLAADIFLANQFHALPVVEEGKLMGIVTSHDLLSYCFNSPVEYDQSTENYSEE